MRKAIIYTTFTIASLMVILLFVTAKSYTQLGVAVVLYPALAYLALNLFQRKREPKAEVFVEQPQPMQAQVQQTRAEVLEKADEVKRDSVGIADIDKRVFLKLIGAAGLSFFIFSIFSKRAEVPFFGKMVGTGSPDVSLKNTEGKKINPAERQPLDGFNISEIDDGVITYLGFTNRDGAWTIMREDTDTNSFRYAKGDVEFPGNWTKRGELKYDYFHNVFNL